MKMNCSALLKQAAVCTCRTAVPLGQILESRCASESDCDQEDAARVSCLVDWSSKTEAKWFELVAVILDEFAYFAIETLKMILNPSRFQTARELWSSQNNEADCMDMQESLVLLREEPLHAFCQD